MGVQPMQRIDVRGERRTEEGRDQTAAESAPHSGADLGLTELGLPANTDRQRSTSANTAASAACALSAASSLTRRA